MPTTPKQIEANRRNAAMSTGPRTEEGKATSSRNAIRHGVLASVVVAQCEDRDTFNALMDDLMSEFRPETRMEASLVEKLAVLLWRERRLVETERVMIDAKREAVEDDPLAGFGLPVKGPHHLAKLKALSLDDQLLIGRYEIMLTNQIMRTLQALLSLQDKRSKTIDAVVVSPEAEAG